MRITVDPVELLAISESLRSCATEAADVGSQLQSCACCAMPAELQPLVDDLLMGADRALGSCAGQFSNYSVDLTDRAQIAATDSLAAAASAGDAFVSPSATVSTATGLGTSMVGEAASGLGGGGVVPTYTTSLVGGGPAAGLGGGDIVPTYTMSVVGGGQQFDGPIMIGGVLSDGAPTFITETFNSGGLGINSLGSGEMLTNVSPTVPFHLSSVISRATNPDATLVAMDVVGGTHYLENTFTSAGSNVHLL